MMSSSSSKNCSKRCSAPRAVSSSASACTPRPVDLRQRGDDAPSTLAVQARARPSGVSASRRRTLPSRQSLQHRPLLVGRSASASPAASAALAAARRSVVAQRRQIEPAAARADGRQQPAGLGGDQQEQRARRRLLQRLQQRVGGVDVELVGLVDDDDAPRVGARASARGTTAQPAHLVDRDGRRRSAWPWCPRGGGSPAVPGCDSARTWRAATCLRGDRRAARRLVAALLAAGPARSGRSR